MPSQGTGRLQGGSTARQRQVWQAASGTDLLVLRAVLALAEQDPEVAATVLAALYAAAETGQDLTEIMQRAEEAPLQPAYAWDTDAGRWITTQPVAQGGGVRVYSYHTGPPPPQPAQP
jgi:hypothetical protein